MSGGMRQRPIDYVQCPVCEDKHEAANRLAGWPILLCPKVKGTAMRYEPGWTAIVVGPAK